MAQEEKQIILMDLCARLPYGVVALKTYKEGSKTMESISLIETDDIDMLLGTDEDIEEAHYTIKPYLRPMSSMTEEEKEEYCNLQTIFLCSSQYPVTDAYELFDWLNKHHFDFHSLIEKGLALEAKEGMYKNE